MSLIDSASLIVTPNAYKEGTLYSVIPSDGSGDLSVTRATTATRINSAGLVELVPYNLIRSSGNISTQSTYWSSNQGGVTNENYAIAPDGTNTASLITPNGVNIYSGVAQTSFTLSNNLYNFSVYLKSNTASEVVRILVLDSATTFHEIFVNTTSNWERYDFDFTPAAGTANVYIVTANSNSFLAWGAQLNEGTLKDYQKTETRLNIPRLDYSNGTCPSILVEPQRTNLATWSNDFSNAVWTKNQSTITSNYAVSPQGIQNASRWLSNSGATLHFLSQLYGFTLGVTYTISCYVKSNTSSNQDFRLGIDGGVTSSNLTATTEWQRFTFTANPTNAVGLTAFFIARPSTNDAVDLSIYGLQLEVGSYPTSYIPTTSASVTRNADVISKTGISSLIGQTEGTMFVDFYVDNLSSQTNAPVIFSFNANNYIEIFDDGRVQYYDGSGNIIIDLPSYGLTNGRHKFAIAYNTNDVAFYIDGALAGTDTSCTPSAKSNLYLGYTDLSFLPKLDYNAVALWKTRLTNDELERLTGVGFNTYTEMANYYNYIIQ